MRLRTLKYHFKEASRSIWRNGWLSLASVITVAISLFILGGTSLLVLNIGKLADNLESNVQMTVFLKSSVTQDQIQSLEEELKNMPGVDQVKYVSKEQALAQMSQTMGAQGDLLTNLDNNNPLPDAFQVKAVNPGSIPALALKAQHLSGVDQVRYGRGVVEKLLAVTHWLRIGSLVVMILVGLSAIFLIATTIRVSVHARRHEIGIMKFLGATNWFVRSPFLLEGVGLGLMGSILAAGGIYAGYVYLVNAIIASMPFIQPVNDPFTLLEMVLALLFGGMFIGALGSVLSLRKYLQV